MLDYLTSHKWVGHIEGETTTFTFDKLTKNGNTCIIMKCSNSSSKNIASSYVETENTISFKAHDIEMESNFPLTMYIEVNVNRKDKKMNCLLISEGSQGSSRDDLGIFLPKD